MSKNLYCSISVPVKAELYKKIEKLTSCVIPNVFNVKRTDAARYLIELGLERLKETRPDIYERISKNE